MAFLEKGFLRISATRVAIRVLWTEFAGQKRKSIEETCVYLRHDKDHGEENLFDSILPQLMSAQSYAEAKEILLNFRGNDRRFESEIRSLKAIEVEPVHQIYEPVKFNNEFVKIEVKWGLASIENLRCDDGEFLMSTTRSEIDNFKEYFLKNRSLLQDKDFRFYHSLMTSSDNNLHLSYGMKRD